MRGRGREREGGGRERERGRESVCTVIILMTVQPIRQLLPWNRQLFSYHPQADRGTVTQQLDVSLDVSLDMSGGRIIPKYYSFSRAF